MSSSDNKLSPVFMLVPILLFTLWFLVVSGKPSSSRPRSAQEVAQIEQNKKMLRGLKKDDLLVLCQTGDPSYYNFYHAVRDTEKNGALFLAAPGSRMIEDFMVDQFSKGHDGPQDTFSMVRIERSNPYYTEILEGYVFQKDQLLSVC